MTERVTVKPGDYVAIKDIETPEQATAIADAFIAAGATPGSGYPYADDNDACWDNLFWDKPGNATNRGSGGERRLKPRQILGERLTLRPGDYVSTAGMTEDQYHAVARAFMAAGCPRLEYPDLNQMRSLPIFGWASSLASPNKGLWHSANLTYHKDGRHLTISQVLNATNAGNLERYMTPCEKLGYKVGDRLEIVRHRGVRAGQTVTLFEDDGTDAPYFVDGRGQKLVIGLNDKEDEVRKVVEEEDTLTQTLRDAAEHDTKAKHHAEEHDRLMQRARSMLPGGWRLVRDDEPEADMDDPANWREGDVVELISDHEKWVSKLADRNEITLGKKYTVESTSSGGKWLQLPTTMYSLESSCFRFHHRPT